MRSIDWSSDVCSSDLLTAKKERPFDKLRANGLKESSCLCTFVRTECSDRGIQPITCHKRLAVVVALAIRSEERRVGKSVSVRVNFGGRRSMKKQSDMYTQCRHRSNNCAQHYND